MDQPGSAPNEPTFFLHHCNVDRLWAAWQAGLPQTRPSTAPYLPDQPIANRPGESLNEPMIFSDNTATSPWPGPFATPADVLDNNAMNYTYDLLPSAASTENPD
jgi:tyrosinase